MTDKRQTVTNVKCKTDKSTTKQSIFVDYSLEEALEVCFLDRRRTQKVIIIDQQNIDSNKFTLATTTTR